MSGCLKNFLAAVGCLTLLVLGGVVAWTFDDQIAGLYRSVVPGSEPVDGMAAGAVGTPTSVAQREVDAMTKALERRGGPPSAVVGADQVAGS
jgi:hypothetical protein